MHRSNITIGLIVLFSTLSVPSNVSVMGAQDALAGENEDQNGKQSATPTGNLTPITGTPQQNVVSDSFVTNNSIVAAKAEADHFNAQAAASTWNTACQAAAAVLMAILVFQILWTRRRIANLNDRLRIEQDINASNQRLLARIEDRLAHSERVESLGVLAGGIAHDFNNLLMGVIANAEAMRSLPKDSEVHGQCLDGIMKSAEVAGELSQKMLAFAGKKSAPPETADLNALVAGLVPLVKSTFRFRHKVKFESLIENAFARIDVTQIEQVLLNLITNAVNAINMADQNGDGLISISVGQESIANRDSQPDLIGARTTGGDFVYFEVADNGIGIPQEDISRVFKPFVTGNKSGRGLGLAVVIGNVNRHDGLIRCQSTVGTGTSFRILLPQAPQPPDNNSRQVATALDRLPAQLRIVAIDDQPVVLESIDRMLTETQWDRELFESAGEALTYLERNTNTVDVVLVDVVMPDMDAAEFLAQLARSELCLPVMMMSGYSSERFEALRRQFPDCNVFLGKPFSREALYRAIETCIGNGQDRRPFPEPADVETGDCPNQRIVRIGLQFD